MSYYENRIKHLEGLVATMAREQRMKAIPVEAKLVERIAEYQAENTRLKAEVERLRKAGDVMADYIMVVPGTPMAHVYLIDWNAAKEGKQP